MFNVTAMGQYSDPGAPYTVSPKMW